jgi:amidophosphoribosyltransferase
MGDFVAFKALVDILKEQDKEHLLKECYDACKAQLLLPKEQIKNQVQRLYEEVTEECISKRIAKIVAPADIAIEIEVIYQSVEGLHDACPHHTGDWYFTGNYPTPGGNKVVNRAFINYMDGKDERAY